ncbi:hypothetical protein JCM5350_007277 [Sporobolomyces pararoseus]
MGDLTPPRDPDDPPSPPEESFRQSNSAANSNSLRNPPSSITQPHQSTSTTPHTTSPPAWELFRADPSLLSSNQQAATTSISNLDAEERVRPFDSPLGELFCLGPGDLLS